MVVVGLSLLVSYGGAAYLLSVLVREVTRDPPPLPAVVAVVVVATFVGGYLNYRFGTLSLISGLDAAELSRARAPGVYARVARLCDRMGRSPPRLLVADLTFPNAFALGGVDGGVVVFDRRLFWFLDADEFEAIVAHELAHLESRDSLVQTLAYTAGRTVAGTLLLGVLPVTLAVTGVARGLAWIRGRPEEWDASPALWARHWLERGATTVLVGLTLLLRAHSRRREYAADDRAAAVTGDPLALARALRTIQRAAEPRRGPFGPFTVTTDDESALARLLSTHPPTDARIRRLVARAGESERCVPLRRPPRR